MVTSTNHLTIICSKLNTHGNYNNVNNTINNYSNEPVTLLEFKLLYAYLVNPAIA